MLPKRSIYAICNLNSRFLFAFSSVLLLFLNTEALFVAHSFSHTHIHLIFISHSGFSYEHLFIIRFYWMAFWVNQCSIGMCAKEAYAKRGNGDRDQEKKTGKRRIIAKVPFSGRQKTEKKEEGINRV